MIATNRTQAEIDAAWQECWDKVWWIRHRDLLDRIANGQIPEPGPQSGFAQGKLGAASLETQYGREELDKAWQEADLWLGRLSALTWLSGIDWDESMDT